MNSWWKETDAFATIRERSELSPIDKYRQTSTNAPVQGTVVERRCRAPLLLRQRSVLASHFAVI
jgi:hypothetical protein